MRRGAVWALVGAAVVVAAAAIGWFWAPFGRPSAPSELSPATTGPSAHPLAALEAGDCFAEFESPWQADFDPVSCEEPHAAELTALVPVSTVLDVEAWPGEEALRDSAMLACQSPEAIDLDAAGRIEGLEIQVRWPASEAEWGSGLETYSCFAVAPELTGSLRP
ncbi:septum formation family protein [Gulosibacter sp. 10]|uniref:septum formation family protein n=1 Tax=Gulosibacter sp. 10 TaxID=1255570 RepID=UPI000B34FC3D|nr:septum formation family protein [Gulosibacter sp. 10]